MRTVKVSQLVKNQFAVFDTDGYTKISGVVGSCVATLWYNGAISAIPVTMVEIGVSGEYVVSFTPDAIGLWELEVKDSTNRIWMESIEARTEDIDSVDTVVDGIVTVTNNIHADVETLQLSVTQSSGNINSMLSKVDTIYKVETGRWRIDPTTNIMTFYDSNGIDILLQFDLKNILGEASSVDVTERVPK